MVFEIVVHSFATAVPIYLLVYLVSKKVRLNPVRTFIVFELFVFASSFLFFFITWLQWLFCDRCVVIALAASAYRAFLPAFYVAVFSSIPAAVALGAYEWLSIKNKVVRGFISVWIGAFVGYSWLVVFPWTLAGLLSLL